MLDEDAVGICTTCKEWTSVSLSCCGDGVEYEGHIIYDLADLYEIEEEE